MDKPKLIEIFADNDEHSHWELRHPDTGELLWSEEGIYRLNDQTRDRIRRLGGGIVVIGTGIQVSEFLGKWKEVPGYSGKVCTVGTFAPPVAPTTIDNIIELKKTLSDYIYAVNRLDPTFEELHPEEPKKKTYQEPPWKFNKPHNHKSEPYGKSNSNCRTARKRKNGRSK